MVRHVRADILQDYEDDTYLCPEMTLPFRCASALGPCESLLGFEDGSLIVFSRDLPCPSFSVKAGTAHPRSLSSISALQEC